MDTKETAVEGTKVVTEADLMKSISALETKVQETAAKVEQAPVVQTATLAKSASDIVAESASEELKKTINASAAFAEFTTLMGQHIDSSLQEMAKSIHSAAERDLGMIKVLGDLRKAIDANTETLKTFGNTTTAPRTVTTTEDQVLQKTVTTQQAPVNKEVLRKQISEGLETLAKSFPPNSPESQNFIRAAIRYESTGEIDDITLRKVQQHYATA